MGKENTATETQKAIDQRIFLAYNILVSEMDSSILSLQEIFQARRKLAEIIMNHRYGTDLKDSLDLLDLYNKQIKEALFLGK